MNKIKNTNFILIEQSIIGGLLMNNNAWEEVSLIINKNSFITKSHQIIFEVIENILNEKRSADIVTVHHQLELMKLSEATGGFGYLAEIAHNVPSVANIETYAKLLFEEKQKIKLKDLGSYIQEKSLQIKDNTELDAFLSNIESKLTDITLNNSSQDPVVDLKKLQTDILDHIETALKNDGSYIKGIQTGLTELDYCIQGLQNGDLVVIAARPSMGKTALALSIIKENIIQNHFPIQFYSLEMPADQIMFRLIANIKRIKLESLKNPQLLEDTEIERLTQGLGLLKELDKKFIIDETPALTIEQMKTRIRRNARLYGMPSLIVIDYIQLMQTAKRFDNRNGEITYISNNLKAIAKEMKCPVITLAQLNRNVESRTNKRPMLSDLRDSGSIEQDADIVLLLYRESYYNKEIKDDTNAEIIIAKHRNGPTGEIEAKFIGKYSSFENDTKHAGEHFNEQ